MRLSNVPAGHRSAGRGLPVKTRMPAASARRSGHTPNVHMPNLDTILMVEKAIKSHEVFETKNQLLRSLPKSMQYPTLLTTLAYLQDSNKIVIEKDGTIIWTFVDTPEARKSLEESKSL
jgi:hypothetical protein